MSAVSNPGFAVIRAPRAPIAILSYHQTGAAPPAGTPYRSLVLPPQRFARQLRWLRRLGWQGLALRDLEPYLQGRRSGKVFGITLDDGYRNNFEHALPVLRALGFTATAFAVSAQVGGSNVWDRVHGVPPAALMDVPQLRDWAAAGMEVGAHTRHHVDLCQCDDRRARDEIAGSKHELEDLIGIPVRSFSYPHGQHGLRHVDMVRQAGYCSAVTVVSARAQAQAEPLRLPRLSVHATEPLPLLLARVATPLEDWRIARRLARPDAAPQPQPQPQWPAPAESPLSEPGFGASLPPLPH